MIKLIFLLILCGVTSIALAESEPETALPEDLAFAPIPLGENDAEVRLFLMQRRYLEAAESLSAKTPETRFAKAWLYAKAKQHEQVVETLKELQHPLLDARIALLRALSLLELRKPQEAENAILIQAFNEQQASMALRIRARAQRELGNLELSRKLYTELLNLKKDSETPVALLGLARVEEAQKKEAEAIRWLLQLDVQYPAHWAAESGRKFAEGLIKKKTALKKLWSNRTAEQRVDRAERWLKIHRNQSVIAELGKVSKKSLKNKELSCRFEYTLGYAHRKLRQWSEGYPHLMLAVKNCTATHHELAPKALYAAAMAADRVGKSAESLKLFKQLSDQYPEHYLADDGVYYELRQQLEANEDLVAAEAMVTEMARRFPKGDMVPDALFHVTQLALQHGEFATALRLLEQDLKLPPKPFDHRDSGRTDYWLGFVHAELGDFDEALHHWRQVLGEYPLSWYALLSYARICELFPLQAQGFAEEALRTPSKTGWSVKALSPDDLKTDALKEAMLLGRLGLADEAKEAMGNELSNDLLLSAQFFDRVGAYNVSHNILRRKLSEYRKIQPIGEGRFYWTLAYPQPFQPLVLSAAEETGVDPAFIWAVMREESGFSVQAESFANALGLMQILLKTGQMMAKVDELPLSRQKAMEPGLNIVLGTRFLALLSDKSKVVPALLPAGYNAGRGALERWLKARGHLPLDLFIETIPFEETRGYTKRVNAAYATYQFLYGFVAGILPKVPLYLRTVPDEGL